MRAAASQVQALDHQGLSLIAPVLVGLLLIASLRHHSEVTGTMPQGPPSLSLRCMLMPRRAWLAGLAALRAGCHDMSLNGVI